LSKLEIERRYLFNSCNIDKLFKKEGISYIISNMEQFYLKATSEETLRFRKEDDKYIKNIKRGSGLVREEIEEEIPKSSFLEAKSLNLGAVIKKDRFKFIIEGNRFELDIFKDNFKGLAILEIEFKNLKEAQNFKMPTILKSRIVKEITNESIYSNGALSRSNKIPLRSDSYISLKENLQNLDIVKKAKFNLYISEYEDTSMAFKNYIEYFLNSFVANYTAYLKDKDLDSLLLAIKTAKRVKSLLSGFRRYIAGKHYINIFFNINNFLLTAQEVYDLNVSFKKLLKDKSKLDINSQTDTLKLLIKIAQELKIKKDNFENCFSLKDLEKLKNMFIYLHTQNLNIPYVYAREVVLKKELKEIKKLHNQQIPDIEIAQEYEKYEDLCKFFNVKIKKGSFSFAKEYIQSSITYNIIKSIDLSNTNLKENLLKLFNKPKKVKNRVKNLKKAICNAN